ncbi:hypothetical protein BH09MYX1_BH09MYX1_53850 [soil metagenome]
MHTVADYGSMIADRVRMAAYVEALRRTVKPGSIVVDVGAGTGIFSLWACKLGAARVYAIESNPAIHLLKDHAKRNGYADRITIFHALSKDVELPERADVLVSDLRGASPLFGRHIETIIDARRRFLRDGGVQIPQRDDLLVALVESEDLRSHVLRGTLTSVEQPFDLSAAQSSVLDSDHTVPKAPHERTLLGGPSCWASVDYLAKDLSTDFRGDVDLEVSQTGTLHGLLLSFRAIVLSDPIIEPVGFDSSGDDSAYRPVFLPWPIPVDVVAGATVKVSIRAACSPLGYILSWSSSVGRERFRQSNFHAFGPPRWGGSEPGGHMA